MITDASQDHRHSKVNGTDLASSREFLLTRPFSTGSAGLIQTIQAFSKPSLPSAIVGTVATVGWVVQGVGLAYYYRQVSACTLSTIHQAHSLWPDLGPSQSGRTFR